MLSVNSSNLDVILGSNFFKLLLVLGKLWQLDMDGSSQSSSAVGWACSKISEVVVVGESGLILNQFLGSGQSVEDGSDITTGLHRDDSELILFVDPDEEGLVVIVEDTSCSWPVSVQSAGLQESVSLLEQEVILDKLLSLDVSEFSEWVVFSLKVINLIHGLEGFLGESFDLISLLSADEGSEWEILKISSDSNSG